MRKIARASSESRSLSWIDGDTWAARSSYWLGKNFKPAKTKITPRRNSRPLIVSGHGAALLVRNGALLVRDGFTHYPQSRAEHRFFPRDPNMPSRIVILDGSGSLSFDVMDWLSSQDVPLIRINWRGEVQSIMGGVGYSADPKRVAWQLMARESSARLQLSTQLIHRKIENSISTAKMCLPDGKEKQAAIRKLALNLDQLSRAPPRSISSLLGIEGNAAIAYFGSWQTLSLKWKGTGRKPIPDDWYRAGYRSSAARIKLKNRNASHPVNAMLNYAYAILESNVRIHILAEGYDPTISFLHARKLGRESLVFDFMEPLR